MANNQEDAAVFARRVRYGKRDFTVACVFFFVSITIFIANISSSTHDTPKAYLLVFIIFIGAMLLYLIHLGYQWSRYCFSALNGLIALGLWFFGDWFYALIFSIICAGFLTANQEAYVRYRGLKRLTPRPNSHPPTAV